VRFEAPQAHRPPNRVPVIETATLGVGAGDRCRGRKSRIPFLADQPAHEGSRRRRRWTVPVAARIWVMVDSPPTFEPTRAARDIEAAPAQVSGAGRHQPSRFIPVCARIG